MDKNMTMSTRKRPIKQITNSDDQGNGHTEDQGDRDGEQADYQTHDQTDEEERDDENVQTGDQTDDEADGQAGDGKKDEEQGDGDDPKDEQTNDQTDDQQDEGVNTETGDQSHTHENITESHNGDEDFEDKSGPLYRLPGLVLDEHMFTLSYEEECTPFRLTYTIPLSQEGARQTDGTDEEEDDAESERGGDGETREVITYDDFGAFRRGEQSLPEMPSLLNGKQANLAKGSSNMIRIDNSNFTTDRQLVISGRLCGLGSRLLLLCPTIDGRSRIRTDDAPSGKCHNVSVYVEAPTISSARLSNEGDGIIIFFNKNVAIKDLRKCSSIFDESTINQLGENAVCKWKDGKNLIVGLGCDTSITTGSSITLRPDRIKAARSTFSHTASGTVNVLAPNDPKPPMAVIDGRPKVPSCGQFALSGRASTGGRSCGLTYEWALVSPTEDVDSRLTDKIQEANDANNDRMVSTTEALPEVTPYTFRLTVTNKLGLSNSTEFTMRKSNVREPWLEIQKSGNIKGTKVSANKKFGIIAQFTFEQATGCEKLAASRAEYQWSVEGVEFDEDALRKRGLRFLPSNLGGASEIAATVTVTYGSPTDQNTKSASVTLTVVKAPLRARIKGGGRITIGTASDSVDLDCSYSEDPSYQGDEPDPGLEFRWECWDETSKNTCDLPSSQEDADVAILTIEPSLLSVDKTYSISCYVNKAGFDEVHDSVKVSVTEGSPPRVSLALLGSKEGSYKPGQDVEIRVMFSGMYNETVLEDLRGGLDGIGDLQYTNIIDKTREDQETAESSSQDSSSDKPYQLTVSKKMTRYTVLVKIDKSILTPGSQYSLGVKVVSESSEGLAEIDFNVYDRVTGCTFEFGVNGDYEDTASDVTYEVSGCSVESLEGLTYRAFAQFRSKKRLLGETSQDSTFTVDHEVLDIVKKSIEAGDAVDFKVGVKVCNTTSGVCSEFLKNATYAMGTLSDEELDEEKQEIQDLKLEGRSVEGLKKANRAQKAKASQTTGVDRKKRAAPDCDQVLLDLQYELLMEATSDEANYNYNPGDVLGMLQADTDVPITCLTLEQQRSTLASTKRVLESARDLEDRLPPETVDGVRQQLEDAKMVYPDAFFFSENRDIFGLLTKGMSKNMALGEKVTSFGESMFISMDYTLNTDAIPISRGDGNIIFLGGDDIKDRFDTSWVGCGCEECVGILLESIVFRGQDYVGGESHDSDVFRLQFFSPCADSTDPIEVRDLSDPIRFWYPVSAQPNDRPVCSFLDQGTDEWSQAGLEAAIDGTDVRCETNHTTEYVVDLINESGQSTSTLPEVTDATTAGDEDDDDDDDDGGHIDIAGINGLIGLGVGVIVGVVVAVIVVLAAVIILIVVVVKHVNKPKMIVEPVVKA
ncbi:uncharacterized protein LOC129262926 [Lytechinus pictus]|uniref:uncharacterized protein LOC129262926 n=1 Tax=Lytechinus pictus TaxID=7653 RepID=UPI0030B9EFF0